MFSNRQQVSQAKCPFNPNHVFAKEKLIFHINRCKDRQKVGHKFATCRYNGLHFILKEKLEEHELFCEDREEVRKMLQSMRRNYEDINRERERSREKRKQQAGESKKAEDDEDDQDHTLSDCEECLATLKQIDISKYPKLQKYLEKYEELSKND